MCDVSLDYPHTFERVDTHKLLVFRVEVDHGHNALVIPVEADRNAFHSSQSRIRHTGSPALPYVPAKRLITLYIVEGLLNLSILDRLYPPGIQFSNGHGFGVDVFKGSFFGVVSS